MNETEQVEPTLAVVTVSYNSVGALDPFLDSIPRATRADVIVLVVDNASPEIDEIRVIVSSRNAHLLELPRNIGYGAAINRGIAWLPSSIRWVLISNPDVVLHAGSVDELLAAVSTREHVGAAGPRVLQPDGSVYPSARRLPSLRVGIGHALFARAIPSNRWTRRYQANELPENADRLAGWLSGSCFLVVRSVFNRIGGFDEGYFMYFEDVDLGARITRAGFDNLYWPTAVVTHTGAHSTLARAAAMERAHHASAYRYVARKYSSWYLWPLRLVLWIGIWTRSLLVSRR